VAAPGHPLAKIKGTVSRVALSKHVQLVLTDRSLLTAGREFGVMSPLAWRLADLGARHAFLRAGPGWGSIAAAYGGTGSRPWIAGAASIESASVAGYGIFDARDLAERPAAGTCGKMVCRPVEMRFGVMAM
jgi:hypothetical protein